MNSTLYLHLGQGRCGSLSIQRFASEHGAALRERGISYPSPEAMGLDTTYPAKRNAPTFYLERKDVPSPLEPLARFLARHEYPKVLMSSEFLLNGDADFLRRLVETARSSGVDVVALAYVREQREWLISRYAKAIESHRWTISLEQYLDERFRSRRLGGLNYHSVFSRLAELFGKERLVIRIFERPRFPDGDVRIDAFDALGVDVRDLIADDPNANASPSIEELEVMRFINQRAEGREFKPRDFLRQSADLLAQTGWEPTRDLYRLVPPGLLREIAEHFSPGNEAFRQEFFPDEPSPLFSSRIPVDYDLVNEGEWLNSLSFELLTNHLLRSRESKRRKDGQAELTAVRSRGTDAG